MATPGRTKPGMVIKDASSVAYDRATSARYAPAEGWGRCWARWPSPSPSIPGELDTHHRCTADAGAVFDGPQLGGWNPQMTRFRCALTSDMPNRRVAFTIAPKTAQSIIGLAVELCRPVPKLGLAKSVPASESG